MTTLQSPATTRPAQITTPELAGKLIAAVEAAMDGLLDVLQRETDLVKRGKLRAAGELAAEKEEKATLYTRLMLVARDEVQTLARHEPARVEALRRRHELFRAEVQINLAVLATAREVAEDLLRSVATEVSTGTAVPVYGRPGAAPAPTAARGIAINRSL